MPRHLQQRLIALVTFVGGLYFFLEFFLPLDQIPPDYLGGYKFKTIHEAISKGIMTIGVMAIGLGVINIFTVHGAAVLFRKRNWFNSLVLLAAFLVTLAVQMLEIVRSDRFANERQALDTLGSNLTTELPPGMTQDAKVALLTSELERIEEEIPALPPADSLTAAQQETVSGFTGTRTRLRELLANNPRDAAEIGKVTKTFAVSLYQIRTLIADRLLAAKAEKFIEQSIYVALGSAMFALLSFYIANAAYRSFRIRSLEASTLMVAAVLVVLGQIPHGPLYISPHLPEIRRWLLDYINTPAFRGIAFGASIAGLAMSLRVWFSLDRGPFSNDDEVTSPGGKSG